MRTFRIGGHLLKMDGDLIVTVLPDGKEIKSYPQENAAYYQRARDLGYGDDAARMSREHEIAHALLIQLLCLEESPTFRGVAEGRYWREWEAEEAAVLALQRFANSVGVRIENLI